MVPRGLVSFSTKRLLTKNRQINNWKQLEMTLFRKQRRSFELRGDLFWKSGRICPAGQQRKSAIQNLLFHYAKERHVKATTSAGNSLSCHISARKLGKDTRDRVECSAIPCNLSLGIDAFHREKDILLFSSWYRGSLQNGRYGQVLIGNTKRKNFTFVILLALQTQSSRNIFSDRACTVISTRK